MRALLYFNFVLIINDSLFIVYASLAFNLERYPNLVCILALCGCLSALLVTNFTFSYFKLARIMYVKFNSDVQTRLKVSTLEAVIKTHRMEYVAIVFIYLLTFIETGFFLWGNFCFENHYLHKEEPSSADFYNCQKRILPAIVIDWIVRILLLVLQIYSFIKIFIVAKSNGQKIKQTLCKQFMFLFVFISLILLSILYTLSYENYLHDNDNSGYE